MKSKNSVAVVENKTQLSTIDESVESYARASLSRSTIRKYETHLKAYSAFIGEGVQPNARNLAQWLSSLADAGKSVSTINQAFSAVSQYCESKQINNPTKNITVKRVMSGIRREKGKAPYKKTALTFDMLKTVIDNIDRNTLAGKRNAAILLLGFAGAFRRSEISALTVADIERLTSSDGRPYLAVTVQHSKTDQCSQGMLKAIVSGKDKRYCPITALDDWLQSAHIVEGAIFRRISKTDKLLGLDPLGDKSIAEIIKAAANAARLDKKLDFSGHSLRSGFVTSAIELGANERQVMNQTGHKSNVVLRGYIQRNEIIKDNAVKNIFK